MIKKIGRSGLKWILFILFDVLVILTLISYFAVQWQNEGIKISGTYMKTSLKLKEFHLTNHLGQQIGREVFKGHWTFVFFGFTNCPKICPTTLAVLNDMENTLQAEFPENQLPHILFISVDPKRDTISRLNHYVQSFNRNFMGANGSIEDVISLEKHMHLTASIDNPLSHSMEVVLVNPEANIQAYFSYPQHAEQLAADYKLLIRLW